jgi:hypothetical protein
MGYIWLEVFMKKNIFLFLSALVFNATLSFAHGEDKLGPNGGYVRMPGAFHTEIVRNGKNKLKVYLLDIDWQNPSVKNSKLKIIYNGKITPECQIEDDHYNCVFAKSVNLTKKGELKITAQRDGQDGMEVSYPLPLKLEKVNQEKSEHSGHH